VAKLIITVRTDASVTDTIRLMRKEHVRNLPVLDRNCRIVRIVGSRDLMKVATEVISI
jgi:CBS-domain-containing membrane protein